MPVAERTRTRQIHTGEGSLRRQNGLRIALESGAG